MTITSATPTARTRRTGPLAVGGAVLATTLVWTTARVLDVDLRVDPGNGQPAQVVELGFAAAVTLAVALLAWGVRALLERLTRRAAAIWTVLAVVVLLASFQPLLYVEATGATKTALGLMHLAVAAVLIPVFGRRRR